jgi:hypothetical protein
MQEGLGREQPAESAEPEEYRTVDGAVKDITSTNVNEGLAGGRGTNRSSVYLQYFWGGRGKNLPDLKIMRRNK